MTTIRSSSPRRRGSSASLEELEIFFGIKTKFAKPPKKNKLSGAIYIAIQDAERFGTNIVIQDKNGKIKEISPAAMRRRLAKENTNRPEK